jgi:glyoxylase-like metal-dependent hydrolase (beta-lactamase superfamily II)
LPDRGVLFTGDALVIDDSILGRTGPRIVCGAFTHDTATAMSALAALAPLDAGIVLPGHGSPYLEGIAVAVAEARRVGVA